MAASLKASGTWAVMSGDTVVTIPGTPAAGDRMYIWAVWKPFNLSAVITSPQAWTEVTEFTDGSVGPGANVGSVKVGCWYRDWVSGDGNPTLDFAISAPSPGLVVCQVWQKDAGDTWGTPTFATAAIAAADPYSATASSTLTITDGAVVFCLTGLRDDSASWAYANNDVALDDDGSPAVTWNGAFVSSPASHGTTTTSNDLAAELVHRFVTTGAAGVSLTTGGDPAAAETGAALWVHQPVDSGISLEPTPVVLDLGVFAPTIGLALTLAPAPVVVDLTVLGGVASSPPIELTPTPVVLDLGVFAPTIGLSLTLTPTPVITDLLVCTPVNPLGGLGLSLTLSPPPVILDLSILSPVLGLSLSLTGTPVLLDLSVPVPTLELGPNELFLTPTPVVLDLDVFVPTLGLLLTLQPTPVVLDLALPAPQVTPGALALAPEPVVLDLRVMPVGQVGPLIIVSGSDHEILMDAVEFWTAYDAADPVTQRQLLRTWLLTHGGVRRMEGGFWVVKGGLFPPRYPE